MEGIQTIKNSLSITLRPQGERKGRRPMGETCMGVQGAKKRRGSFLEKTVLPAHRPVTAWVTKVGKD
jgi:hypothetical protein